MTTTNDERVLTEDEKIAIRDVYQNGAGEFSIRQIASHFGIRKSVVYEILKGEDQASSTSGVDKAENDDTESAIDQTNPKIRWTEAWWANAAPQVQAHRCVAHRKNGDRCRRAAINGATVCRTHGGATRHIRNAAKVRLQNAADLMARELLKMATDDNVSDAVKLAAIKDALDRGGLGAKTEVEVTAKPYEGIISRIQGGSREEYRRSVGSASAPPLPLASADPTAPIDAEVVDAPKTRFSDLTGDVFSDSDDFGSDDSALFESDGQCYGPGDGPTGEPVSERPAHDDTDGPREPPNPFDAAHHAVSPGMMSLDQAVSAAAELRRASAHLRPIQRALPRGRS